MRNILMLTFILSSLGLVIRIIAIASLNKQIVSLDNIDLIILVVIIIFSGVLLFKKNE